MCTVSYLPVNNQVLITSNRDEKKARSQALPPATYTHNGVDLVFPKDRDAGGSWIALRNNGTAVVLLNGGFVKHIPAPPYARSRGLVLLDVIASDQPVYAFRQIDLFRIEPFTLVITGNGALTECRWDGVRKHHISLDERRPHIWSSVTLYDDAVIRRRQQWFQQWLLQHTHPTQDDILHFHQFAGEGDPANDLRMNRNELMLTVSVTSIALGNRSATMKYLDLGDNSLSELHLPFSANSAAFV